MPECISEAALTWGQVSKDKQLKEKCLFHSYCQTVSLACNRVSETYLYTHFAYSQVTICHLTTLPFPQSIRLV